MVRAPEHDQPRSIVIDPERGFGRPTVPGKGVRSGSRTQLAPDGVVDQVDGDAVLRVHARPRRRERTAAPLDVVTAAMEVTAPMFESRKAFARKRRALIAAHAELHEREPIKSLRLASTIAASVRDRGVVKGTADLVARTGMIIFQNAFERCTDDLTKRDLAHHVRAAVAEFQQVIGGSATAKRSKTYRKNRAAS